MRIKDNTVETNFHPILTQLLFHLDDVYRAYNTELIITSGSEHHAKHGVTSLHYAQPACAVDIRTRRSGIMPETKQVVKDLDVVIIRFCCKHKLPRSWVELILEKDHIHIEFQPKGKGF